MNMISEVLERVIPEDRVNLHGGVVPWLPEFVPKVGLEIVKNGILSFSGANILEHLAFFIESQCHLRQQSNYYENLMREFYISLKENESISNIYTKSESKHCHFYSHSYISSIALF